MANKPDKPRIVVITPRRPGFADSDLLGRPNQPKRNPQRISGPGPILGRDKPADENTGRPPA